MLDFEKHFDPEKLGIPNHARTKPDIPALIMNDTVVSFKELDRDTNVLASILLRLGVRPSDHICILMYNSSDLLKAWAAAGKIGATPIVVNYRFKEDELAYIINDSESKLLIHGSAFQEVVDKAKPHLTARSLQLICSGGSTKPGILNLEELMKGAADTPPKVGGSARGVSSSLIYTSGTTGRPKGVFKKSRHRLNSLLGYAYTFESTYDDTHLVAGPLYHAAPYAWSTFSLILGNTVIIMERFDAEAFLRCVHERAVTTTFLVPTMLNRIVHLPAEVKDRYDTSSLRVITVGAESFPFPLKKKVIDFFGDGKLFEFYGGSEIGVVTYMRPEDQLRKPGSCGKPAMGTDIKLLDENKNEVALGEVGTMYVKSDFLLDGYFRNPLATEANYHNGYFTVGDMGRMDEDGYYYIVDRAVDMIISGGVNIYPAEIEEVLYNHPDVYDGAIIGVPDPDWGEKIVAYVLLQENAETREEDIIEYIGQRLASYKKPKEVILVEELPYSPAGKLLKRVLRSEYALRSR